jgi:hypothetical protein
MIEVLHDMPAGVTGIRVSGRLTGDDFRAVKPIFDRLGDTGEIRIVEVIDSDYAGFGPGGLIEDTKMGLGALFRHHSKFKRIAVVTDKEWVVHTLHVLAWMVPGEMKVFSSTDVDAAKEWAAADVV